MLSKNASMVRPATVSARVMPSMLEPAGSGMAISRRPAAVKM
ncbi:hypothetical protein [Actinophytocola gossypii]|nr:hypothetical protein [Actinophytocola gossypii]